MSNYVIDDGKDADKVKEVTLLKPNLTVQWTSGGRKYSLAYIEALEDVARAAEMFIENRPYATTAYVELLAEALAKLRGVE